MTDDELWASLGSANADQRCEVLQMLGWRAIKREKWGEAVALLEEAKAAFEKIGKSSDARMCEHWMARCATNMGDVDAATERHQRVLDSIAADGPLDQLGAKTADAIGCEYRDRGQYREAIDYFALAARAHEANHDLHWAADSALKWVLQIRATGLWHQMPEATELMLRVSTDVDKHVMAHVGTVLAACALVDDSANVDAVVAKCERLVTASEDADIHHELQLAKIAVAQFRGDCEHARKLAMMGKDAAQATGATEYHARFLIAGAENLVEHDSAKAEDLLLTAHDLAEVLRNHEILDRAAMSLMHLREQRYQPEELPFAG